MRKQRGSELVLLYNFLLIRVTVFVFTECKYANLLQILLLQIMLQIMLFVTNMILAYHGLFIMS